MEEFASPTRGFACAQVPALALHQEATEPSPHVGVDLIELRRGVPGAEVVAPAAQHGVDVADDHLMLRPAFLLPPKRLSTSRSGHGDLAPLDLGPATGRSGAYPDGTFTRWNSAA